MDKAEILLRVVALVVILVVGDWVFHDYRECSARGGAFVRAIVWWDCVEPRAK